MRVGQRLLDRSDRRLGSLEFEAHGHAEPVRMMDVDVRQAGRVALPSGRVRLGPAGSAGDLAPTLPALHRYIAKGSDGSCYRLL